MRDGEVAPGESTSPTTAVELCDPPADDGFGYRSEFAQVTCDAPDGTNLSVVHVTPPDTQSPTVQVGSTDARDVAPWVQLTTTGLWSDVAVSGDRATFTYSLAWSPTPKDELQLDKVDQTFTEEVGVGDTVTHGPLSYEVLGITDTGDPLTSHLDLVVSLDPSVPLE